jgi:uncharacterized protein GlcG (DUF336 family)
MVRFYAFAAAAGFAALTGANALAADSLPTETHKYLPADLAVEAAQAAVAACKAKGFAVTVTIADRTGNPRVVLMGDGASALSREVTRRKAYTSAVRGITTRDYTARVSAPGAFNPGLYDPQYATGLGGVPIKVGDDTIGAIAAGGTPSGDTDEACALAGLAKISDRLK